MAGDGTIDRWRIVEAIFHRALDLPQSQRLAALPELCAGDAGLIEEVASLVAAEAEQQPADGAMAPPEDTWIGRRLGSFRIERLIGRGGMGAVYLSRRVEGDFDQVAAAKIVFTRLTAVWLRERFLVERQLLASLNHPNIARLIGGGFAEDGEPYLLMEYIEGEPLDAFCERTGAGVEAILRLMIQLCEAVSYAHRNLIVHRDLKPGNVLVTPEGQVKLLDFGTAKLLAADSKAEGTRLGLRAFTPEYASPEQLFGDPVSTSTDVYSLGVILYRLSTGQLPYEIPDSAVDAARTRFVEPLTPSDVAAGPQGAQRPARISADLDAIVLKALRPSPSDRYASPDELAADLERFLGGRPVRAREGSFRYYAAKWLRRNSAGVAAAALVATALAGGVWAAARQGRIAAEEEQRARAGYAEVRKLARLLLVDFYDQVKQVPGSAEVQRGLVSQAQTFLDRLDRESGGDPDTLLDLSEAYRKSADLLGNPYEENLGDTKAALASYERGLAAADRLHAIEPSSARATQAAALLRRGMSETLFSLGRAQEAIAHSKQAAADLFALATRPGAPLETISEAASAYDTLGDQYGLRGAGSLGNAKDAEGAYRKSLELHETAFALDPKAMRPMRGRVVEKMKIAGLYAESDPARATRELQDALAAFERIPRQERRKAPLQRVGAMVRTRLGAVLAQNGGEQASVPQLEEARRVYEGVLILDAEDQRARFDLAIALEFLAHAKLGLKQFDPSLAANEQVIAHLEALLRKTPDNAVLQGHAANAFAFRARVYEAMGRGEDAARAWQLAWKRMEPVAGSAGATANDLHRAAEILLTMRPERMRDPVKAARYAQRAVESSQQSQPAYLLTLGEALAASGNRAEAQAVFEKAAAATATGSALRSRAEAALLRLR